MGVFIQFIKFKSFTYYLEIVQFIDGGIWFVYIGKRFRQGVGFVFFAPYEIKYFVSMFVVIIGFDLDSSLKTLL